MLKKEIRKQFKQLRAKLTAVEREQMSQLIFERAVKEFDFSNKKVSLFLPIERFYEINTWHFIAKIKATFYLPVISSQGELNHIAYENKAQLEVSNWGIPEPKYGETIKEEELDYVLVPLLAYDKKGYRTGYGKGFYDAFLSRCSAQCRFIGLSYFDPIDAIEDLHKNDVQLHNCITPNKLFVFNPAE